MTSANGFGLLGLSARGLPGGSAGRGVSGQLVELQPGATRPPVWTLNADAVLFVVRGTIELTLYIGNEYTGAVPEAAHSVPPPAQTQTLSVGANQAAYIPMNALYYFTAGCAPGGAKLTIAFDHPEWEEIDMRSSLALFPRFERAGSLNAPAAARAPGAPM